VYFYGGLFVNRKWVFLFVNILIVSFFSGCTSEQIFATGQAYQRNQCIKVADQDASSQCLNRSNTRYDDYKYEVDKANK